MILSMIKKYQFNPSSSGISLLSKSIIIKKISKEDALQGAEETQKQACDSQHAVKPGGGSVSINGWLVFIDDVIEDINSWMNSEEYRDTLCAKEGTLQ